MILGRTGMACWNGARIVLVDEWLEKGVRFRCRPIYI